MSKAEKFIEEHTNTTYNYNSYAQDPMPWLTPDDARKAVEIAREETYDKIWHNPDEEPEIDRKIIWESENFLGKHLDKEWKPRIDCFGRKERWCYLADILPSKNWTGERPYSKVDYSRGYDDGYSQAEKDLELTWKDIETIGELRLKVALELRRKELESPIKSPLKFTTEDMCKEVLKRFKAQKEK